MKTINETYNKASNEYSKSRPVTSNLHTIYMTNKCNLACTYCYEELTQSYGFAGPGTRIPNQEQLKVQLDTAIDTDDPTVQTNVLLFGGEPLMQWPNMKYCMEYAFDKKNNIHFGTVTNGVLFTKPKFLEDFNNFFTKRTDIKQKFSLDISFDGIGNGERVYRSGKKSTLDVIDALKIMSESDYNWRMRYTIQKDNVDHFAKDILRIAKTFGPRRIITSIDNAMGDDLNDIEHNNLAELVDSQIDKLREEWIARRLHTSVCEFFCDHCNGCTGQHGYKHYYTDKGLVRRIHAHENMGKFYDFDPTNIDLTGSSYVGDRKQDTKGQEL